MSQEENKESPEMYPCPECQVGVLHLRHITYFTQLASDMVTVPEFPAWVCDVCGRREYDHRAISWLSVILDSQTGGLSRRPRRSRPSTDETPIQTTSE